MSPHFLSCLGRDFVHSAPKLRLYKSRPDIAGALMNQYHCLLLKTGKNDKVEETLKIFLGMPVLSWVKTVRETYEKSRWESLGVSSSLAIEELGIHHF